MKQRFFKCEHCGNIYALVKDCGVPVMCCGEIMAEKVASLDATYQALEVRS